MGPLWSPAGLLPRPLESSVHERENKSPSEWDRGLPAVLLLKNQRRKMYRHSHDDLELRTVDHQFSSGSTHGGEAAQCDRVTPPLLLGWQTLSKNKTPTVCGYIRGYHPGVPTEYTPPPSAVPIMTTKRFRLLYLHIQVVLWDTARAPKKQRTMTIVRKGYPTSVSLGPLRLPRSTSADSLLR